MIAYKEYLSVSELCDYLNIKKSTVHKFSSQGIFPTYRIDNGKLIYFKRSEIDSHLFMHRTPSIKEIQEKALSDLTDLGK